MGLNYEMAKYTELTGEDGTKVPVSRLGGYLDGYEKGRRDVIDEYRELLKNYFVIPHDLQVIDMYAEELKEKNK